MLTSHLHKTLMLRMSGAVSTLHLHGFTEILAVFEDVKLI